MPAAKKTKKKTATKENSSKPPIEEGSYSVVFNTDELLSLAQILSVSSMLFEKVADEHARENNIEGANVYRARSKLSVLLYNKLKTVAGIGEPTSREVH